MKKRAVVIAILCGAFLIGGNINSEVYAHNVKQYKAVQKVRVLNQKEALKILVKKNNKVKYIYQGNEKAFKALRAKKLKGYVFLPDVPGDIGYFVNKNNRKVYYFHPSGYLELIK
ncbi:hypothetical protein [Romboutsia sp. MSSM.1001216sp_RTP31141st1_G3_RTP31141_220114]|uniref:hypothetical protein n=1 Tax=unclassified Romboutsia TaxID=2626894 RepID=UPI0031B5BA47